MPKMSLMQTESDLNLITINTKKNHFMHFFIIFKSFLQLTKNRNTRDILSKYSDWNQRPWWHKRVHNQKITGFKTISKNTSIRTRLKKEFLWISISTKNSIKIRLLLIYYFSFDVKKITWPKYKQTIND